MLFSFFFARFVFVWMRTLYFILFELKHICYMYVGPVAFRIQINTITIAMLQFNCVGISGFIYLTGRVFSMLSLLHGLQRCSIFVREWRVGHMYEASLLMRLLWLCFK